MDYKGGGGGVISFIRQLHDYFKVTYASSELIIITIIIHNNFRHQNYDHYSTIQIISSIFTITTSLLHDGMQDITSEITIIVIFEYLNLKNKAKTRTQF